MVGFGATYIRDLTVHLHFYHDNIEHVTGIAGNTIFVPCHEVKSLQLTSRTESVDEIYGRPIFKWVVITLLKDRAPG